MSEAGNRNSTFGNAALEHLDALYGFAMTLTRNQTEAEDLVQETYLRAVRAFGRLMPDSNLKSWLFAIMRNAWLNQLRHTRGGPRFVELDAEEDDRANWLDHVANDPHVVYIESWSARRSEPRLRACRARTARSSCFVTSKDSVTSRLRAYSDVRPAR